MMVCRVIGAIVAIILSLPASGQIVATKPRLVVNIVVGGVSAGELDRYAENFAITGFKRLRHEGITFDAAHYGALSSSPATALATLSTGASPAIHGVVGNSWFDRVTSERIALTHDNLIKNIKYDFDNGGDSAIRLVAPTLSEALRDASHESRTLTVALNAESAIALNGHAESCYWIDPRTGFFATSTAFTTELPEWLEKINKKALSTESWSLRLEAERYINTTEFGITKGIHFIPNPKLSKREQGYEATYNHLAYTPAGNRHLLDMAYKAIEALELGSDETSDMVNISLDTSRNIISRYGKSSREVEDMYYNLDRDLGRFFESVRSYVKQRDVIFVLTSDGGSSTGAARKDRLFNSDQFAMILNTFLGSKYGAAQWVLGYANRSIYLNHSEIYNQKLDLEQMQREVATFALQFRGVSHALTATALTNTYFGGGFAQSLQRSFYPRRSGDVVINLMPHWIEQHKGVISQGGSIYAYDTHIPLFIMGSGVMAQEVTDDITMEDLSPTLSKIIGIAPPAACEGKAIKSIFNPL